MTEVHEPSSRRQRIVQKKGSKGGVWQGILLGSVLGILSPFMLQFGASLGPLVGMILGFWNLRKNPHDKAWRSFTLTSAVWVLVNGTCAVLIVGALTHHNSD